MVSPKSQYKLIIENVNPSNQEQLQILDTLIKNSSSIDDLVKYYAKRVFIFFEMEKYNDVLADFTFLEQNNGMNDELLLLKWKSILHVEVKKVRVSVRNTLTMKSYDNVDHVNFLNAICKEKVHDLIKNKNKKRHSLKRLRK